MSIMGSIWGKTTSFEEAFGAADCSSTTMQRAIASWYDLYYDEEIRSDSNPCQRIPYAVVNKLTKTVFGEYTAASDDPFAQGILTALDKTKKSAMQQALIGGECFLKPFPMGSGFSFTVIGRSNCLIFGRDIDGNPTDIGMFERTKTDKRYYTLLERRSLDDTGRLTIHNRLYQSDNADILGTQVRLDTLSRYAPLQEVYTYPEPIGGLGLIRLHTPMENCVDGSNDSVSVYAAAAGLIRLINLNEAQINGEFERGESRIITSADLLKEDGNGRRRIKDHVFVGLDDDIDNVGVTIFSPAFREQSFLARKTEYLRNVETLIGFKRGILSDVEAAERTATEVTSSAGDYNLTIIDFQQMWEQAVKDAVLLCGRLGESYHVPGARGLSEDDVTIDWGNGILYDEAKTWAEYVGMVSSGMLKPEIALAWRFNLPWETPADLQKIREKYMPELSALAGDV